MDAIGGEPQRAPDAGLVPDPARGTNRVDRIDRADGVPAFHQLHPAARLIWRIEAVGWTSAIGLGACVVAGLAIGPGGLVVAAALAAIAVAVAWWYPARRYRHWQYVIGDDALEVRRGVWWCTSAAVPFHRIQQIDVEQGPLQRRHDVVTLRLRTAAAASEGHVPHLAAAEADRLRSRLLAIARSVGDDGH